MYRPTKPDHLRFQKKRRRRSCCPVLLCSSPSTWDVGVVTSSPHMKMGYCSSPIQRDDYSVVMSAWGLLVFSLEPYCTRMLSGCNRQKRVRAYSHQRRTFFSAAEILLRIYQNPMHLNGARWRTTFFRRRTSRCLQNLVRQRVPSKCMGFWYIRSRISTAEKTRVFGVNRP